MKISLQILSLLALLVVTAPATFAKDKAAKTDAKKEKTASKYTSLYAQVDSITDTLLTTKGTGADTKFVISADTKITKDTKGKEPAKVADVKAGQWIGGSYTKGTDGTNTLHSLHLDVDQTGGKKTKEKKDKTKA